MLLPEIAKPDQKILLQQEVAFKFMRHFADIFKVKKIPYRAVRQLNQEFSRLEIANVTRDNAQIQAARAAGMVMQHNAGNNVFEFSRIAVAEPETNPIQFTIHFYGRWKTEVLHGRSNAETSDTEVDG